MASPGTDQAANQVEAAVAQSGGKVDSHVHDEINATIQTNGVNTPEAMNDLQGKLTYLLPGIVLEDAGAKNLLAADGGISQDDVAGLATNSDGQDQLAAAALKANFDNIDANHDHNITEAELKVWRTGVGQRTDSQPSGTPDMQSWLGPQDSETVFMRDYYSAQLSQINGISNGAIYYPDSNGQWLEATTGAKITSPNIVDFDGYNFGQFSFQYQDGPLAGSTVVHKTDNSEVTTSTSGQVQQVRYPNGDVRTFTYGADGVLATVVMKPKDGDAVTTDVTGKHGTVLADGTLMLDSDDGQSTRILVTSGDEHTVAKIVAAPAPVPDDSGDDQQLNLDGQTATGDQDRVDPNQEASQTTTADGSTVHLNAAGQPIKVKHGGQITTFEYDADGKIRKITPPEGSINLPLTREGDQWKAAGSPVELTNMVVNADGSYQYHWKDGGGEFDITNKTDGSQLYFQNGQLRQVDFPNKPRGVAFNDAENPTEVKVNDGSKTYVKTDAGWVNKDDDNDKFASITATADGTVTFKRADNSQVVYHTDGTTQEIAGDAPPVTLGDDTDYNKEVKVITGADGAQIHVNSQGQPVKVEYKGAVTTFEYDNEGKVSKITPPEGTIGLPLHRDGDKWDTNGTPVELTNMKVNADGSYSFHWKDSGGEYDINMRPGGSRVFLQNGKVLQVDFPTHPRGVQINNPENPTEIQANGKTYTRTDAGWVNKDDGNDKFTSITAAPDGTVTFTRADKSQVLLKSDGTTQDIAAPTDNDNNNGTDQTTTQTLPDGSIVIKDSQGRVVETKGKDGSDTKYTYDDKGLSGVSRTWGNGNEYSEHYRRNADGTWTKTSRVLHMPDEDTSEKVDKVEVDPQTGALKATTGDVVHIEQVNGDDTFIRGNTTVEVKKNEKGEYQSITTTVDGKVVETLSREGDKWVRTGPDGSKMDVTNVGPDGKGGYSYHFETPAGDVKVTRNLDNSQQIEMHYKNGNTRTDSIDTNNKLVKTVNTDSSVNPAMVEEVTYGADGQPTGVKVYPKDHPDQAQDAKDVKAEANGAYSYTLGEGDKAVRVTVNLDGSRVEGKLLADGTRQVTRVLHKEGDYFQLEYDEQGKISKVTQVFPPNSKNADGSSPRTTETWTPDPEHPGMYKRSSDGMPGRDLEVDQNGNFRYTYTNPDGSLHRHTEVATGQNPPDEDIQGDVTHGKRTFKVGEDGSYTYDIVSGDCLWRIASDILGSQGIEKPTAKQIWEVINRIAQENNIQDVNLIYTGNQLHISKEIMNDYKPKTEPPANDENGDGTDNYDYN